jgi:hypothetical protein
MKTQKELIEYYTKNLEKVISAHGLGSGHFYMATFQLKGVQMGLSVPEMLKWARIKMDELHEETLNFV